MGKRYLIRRERKETRLNVSQPGLTGCPGHGSIARRVGVGHDDVAASGNPARPTARGLSIDGRGEPERAIGRRASDDVNIQHASGHYASDARQPPAAMSRGGGREGERVNNEE